MQKVLFAITFILIAGFSSEINAQINTDAVINFQIDQKIYYRSPDVTANDYNTTFVDDEEMVSLEDLEKHYPLPSTYFYDLLLLSNGILQPVIWDEKGNSMGFRIENETLVFYVPSASSWLKREIDKE